MRAAWLSELYPRWCGKYLSKRTLINHTCLSHDKLIVLWTLNGQAKIFLCALKKVWSGQNPYSKICRKGYLQHAKEIDIKFKNMKLFWSVLIGRRNYTIITWLLLYHIETGQSICSENPWRDYWLTGTIQTLTIYLSLNKFKSLYFLNNKWGCRLQNLF